MPVKGTRYSRSVPKVQEVSQSSFFGPSLPPDDRVYGNSTIKRFAIGRVSPVAWVSETRGGVSPIGWTSQPEITLIDEALNGYDVVWAASGHPHAVYPTSFDELVKCTGAQPMIVGD